MDTNENQAPARLCCGHHHYGPVCPDGRVLCQLCFTRIKPEELYVRPDGTLEDVCKACVLLEKQAFAQIETNKKPRFRRGDYVRKIKGSQWIGYIVGEYSTKLTPEGYAVESWYHEGSVQIYPADALASADPPTSPSS